MSKDEVKDKEKISKKLGIVDEPINETDKYNNDILGYIMDKYNEKFSSTNIRDKMKEIDCVRSIRLGNGKLESSFNRSRLMLDIPGEKIVIATVNVLRELVGNIVICFPETY